MMERMFSCVSQLLTGNKMVSRDTEQLALKSTHDSGHIKVPPAFL